MKISTWFKKTTCKVVKTVSSVAGTVVNCVASVAEYVGEKEAATSLRQTAKRIEANAQKWERREKLYQAVGQMEDGYRLWPTSYPPEPMQEHIEQESTDYLRRKFKRGIGRELACKTLVERSAVIEQVTADAARIFGVAGIKVKYFVPRTKAQCNTIGFYRPVSDHININLAYLDIDNPAILEEVVMTVMHEMIHAHQWAAVTLQKDFGYSDMQLGRWLYNFEHYIRQEWDDWSYRMQPLEVDAYDLEDKIKMNLKKK